jgi:hypothetical protein
MVVEISLKSVRALTLPKNPSHVDGFFLYIVFNKPHYML